MPTAPGHCPYCDVMGGRPVVIGGEATSELPAHAVIAAVRAVPHAPPAATVRDVEEDGHAPPGVATALVGTMLLIV